MKEKNRIYWQFTGSLCFLIFMFLGYVVKFYPQSPWLIYLDAGGRALIQQVSPWKTQFFLAITQLASTPFLIGASVVIFFLLLYKRQKWAAAWFSFMMLVGSVIATPLLKQICSRPRPTSLHFVTETSYSYPSGHSIAAVCFYGTILFLSYVLLKNTQWRWLMQGICSVLLLLIPLSRIYLGVHFTSDVLGGLCFSFGLLFLSYPIYRQRQFIADFTKGKRK